MTNAILSHRTAEEIFNEYSTTYSNNIKTWVDACIEVGTFKESLEYEAQSLYTPLVKEVTREALDKIKTDFAQIRGRLQKVQQDIQEYHPELQRGIVDIKRAIDAQAKQDLSGLDVKLQEKAQELAVIARQHLQTLEYNEKHVNLLESRFAKRLSQDAEARWIAFNTAYDARVCELNPQPKQSGLIARLFGYGYAGNGGLKSEEKNPDDLCSSNDESVRSAASDSSDLTGPALYLSSARIDTVPPQIIIPDPREAVVESKSSIVSIQSTQTFTPSMPRASNSMEEADASSAKSPSWVKGGGESSSFHLPEASSNRSDVSPRPGSSTSLSMGKHKHNKGGRHQ
jgi:hypothetical protein